MSSLFFLYKISTLNVVDHVYTNLILYQYFNIADPSKFTRPKTLGVIPDDILNQMRPVKNFIKLKILTERQKKNLDKMLEKGDSDVEYTIIKYLRRNTNAKETFDEFIEACDESLQKQVLTYLQIPPHNGKLLFVQFRFTLLCYLCTINVLLNTGFYFFIV